MPALPNDFTLNSAPDALDPGLMSMADRIMSETDPANEQVIERDPQEPDPARAALVKRMAADVKEARQYWSELAFKRMRADQRFAAGEQWPTVRKNNDVLSDDPTERYVANLTLRHIHQRTAGIYGKNPRIVARRRERLLNTVWDGSFNTLRQALQAVQMGMIDPASMAILMDAQKVLTTQQQLTKIARTLELLFEHEIEEQSVPFKVQMKATVRRALTTGVGYVKLGFQRVMGQSPDLLHRITDMSNRLATIEQLSADMADGVALPDGADAEQLRLALQAVSQEEDIIVREGLTLSYPDSTAIIPDKNCKQLRGFVGCGWVAEEYFLTNDQIKQLYGVDVSRGAANYRETELGSNEFERAEMSAFDRPGEANKDREGRHCVWQVYNQADNLVYVVCDGYPDFLEEPRSPDVWLERFWPWFALVFNEVYDDKHIYPPSDVRLIRDMQHEINRSRQALREHRRAARPKTVVQANVLEETDKDAIRSAEANAIIELKGLQPNQKVEDVLQPWKGPALDPALYDTNPAFEDWLRVTGMQEANLGGTSNATATESSIAEGSRATASGSVVDDLDEFLTEIARAGGQILLRETSVETVRNVVGPGAVWPDLTRDEIAREIYLEVEAASTGRPNRAQEVQVAQQLMPFLLQIPGIQPEWLGRELIRRMDDKLDLTEAFAAGVPSIQMMNRMMQMTGAAPQNDPNAQGPQGGNNAPSTKPPRANVAPRDPGPMPGAAGAPPRPMPSQPPAM